MEVEQAVLRVSTPIGSRGARWLINERIAELLPTADIFCGHAKVPVPWDEVVAGGRLRWIQSSAAGMDHCLVPSVIASEILVTSASGLFAAQRATGQAVGFIRTPLPAASNRRWCPLPDR